MSFSSEIKLEIMNANYPKACCRRSLLDGALAVKGACENGRNITLSVDGIPTAEFLGGLVKVFFSDRKHPECGMRYFIGRYTEDSFK